MFSDPQKNIDQFHLGEGMKVADLGSGTGAYSYAAARKVGDSGKVYAVEIQKELLQKIKNAAQAEGLDAVEVLWGDIEELGGTKIADSSVDAAILSNILFQVDDKKGVLAETKRILRAGGKVLVVDWSESFGGLGPQEGDVVSADKMKHLFGDEGFVYDREIEAGAHHYGLVFKKI